MSAKSGRSTPNEWTRAYASGDGRVRPYFHTDCYDWRPAVARRPPGSVPPLGDAEIEEWRELLFPHVQDKAYLAEIEKLRDPAALVSVTGQQAGAGLGPLFAFYKAFGARHWALQIERETGRPAVTVFWVASDDHDLEEVQAVRWIGNDGFQRAGLAAPDAAKGSSVHRVPIDPDRARAFLDSFAATTNETEFRPGIMEALEQALLSPGANFESQFLSLACRWLLPLGIIPVVPRLRFLRRRASALLKSEIQNCQQSNELLRSEGERLSELGWQPPIHRGGNEINAFLDWEGARGKLVVENGMVRVLHPGAENAVLAEMTREELLGLLETEPERFSPNAPLRPLVQDSILPVAVYTAGPTEHLYHGQIGRLYELHGVTRPAIFPRPAAALLEPRVARAAEKLGLGAGDLAASTSGELDGVLQRAQAAGGEGRESEKYIAAVEEALKALTGHLSEAYRDTAVLKSGEKLTSGAGQGIGKLRERIAHHLESADSGKSAAKEKLLEALFPGGVLQERGIEPLAPLLVNHGPGILHLLAEHLSPTEPGIQPIRLRELVPD